MSLNWINWGLVWIAQHKPFHCAQESNLLTSHQQGGQSTEASHWSPGPDTGLWLAETSVGVCSLSRGANWNEWVLMRVWRQGDTRHKQGASHHHQMEIEIKNKSNHWSSLTLWVYVNCKLAPGDICWLLGNRSLSQQFFQQNTKRVFVFWGSLCLIITDLFWSNNDKCWANEDRVRRPSPDAGMVTDRV